MQRTFSTLRQGPGRRLRLAVAAFALGLFVAPQLAPAQTFRAPDPEYQGIILQAYGAMVIPLGSEFNSGSVNLDPGPGVGAGFRWVFPNMISAGGGIRYSAHNVQGFSQQNSDFFSLFGEIGYTFIFDSSPIRPTLGGRIGWTSQKLPGASRNGMSVGAFGGVEIPLSQVVALAGTLTFDFLVLDELPGTPLDGTAQLFGLEAGVVIIP
jgi:hypothetical protein